VVAPFLDIDLTITDLRHLDEGEREARAIQIAAEEAHRPFDLAKWPLMQTRLLRMDDEAIFSSLPCTILSVTSCP
jgi:hypothetical protein